MILWFLPTQYSTHYIFNANQIANKRILIGKTDLEAAYRQIHANARTASTCIAIVNELAFLCLRLPFVATPAPAEYMTFSEAAIDLGVVPAPDGTIYIVDINGTR